MVGKPFVILVGPIRFSSSDSKANLIISAMSSCTANVIWLMALNHIRAQRRYWSAGNKFATLNGAHGNEHLKCKLRAFFIRKVFCNCSSRSRNFLKSSDDDAFGWKTTIMNQPPAGTGGDANKRVHFAIITTVGRCWEKIELSTFRFAMTMFVSSDVPPNEANIAREVFFSVKAIFGTFPPLSFPQRLHGMRSERRKFPFSAENLPTSSFFLPFAWARLTFVEKSIINVWTLSSIQ